MKNILRIAGLIAAGVMIAFAVMMKEKNNVSVVLFLVSFSIVAFVLKSFQKGVDAPK
ncbi:MAG TPA: hypothetical protein PK624_06130 [Spirochaetota bacterium]|nr:hypothetical protein [Spirochaetota bacterium]HOR44356.1 hypothetical protein [Spirochaetota bacterium]HOU85611.1 hypothetical protein [Spirochaetota bacterium]HPK55835.1 hypothetical protein [Spirochaetota bacterium]